MSVVEGPVAQLSWGDVPSWLSATASLLALVFAAFAVVVARRTFRIESERDRHHAVERAAQDEFVRRSQAALISAWWGPSPDDRGDGATTSWGVHVRNASETPAYRANLTIADPHAPEDAAKLGIAVVPPGGAAVFHPVVSLPSRALKDSDRAADHRLSLTFTDAAGVRWMRDAYGRLTELRPSLVIWGVERVGTVLDIFAEDFRASYGVALTHHTDAWSTRQETYLAAGRSGRIADVLDAPHDWIGSLVANDVIEPIVLSAGHANAFQRSALDALTYEGKLYGVPVTTQCPYLLRNLDLAPEPPRWFEDVVAKGQQLRSDGDVEHVVLVRGGPYGDPFHLSPLFSSAGGQLFGRDCDGAWDPDQLAVASAASIAAFERLRTLGPKGTGVLCTDIDQADVRQQFIERRTAFLIGTSDDLFGASRAGVPCAVSPVPGFVDGRPPQPFLSVMAFFVAKRGENKMLAHDLISDYLTRIDVATAISRELAAPPCLKAVKTTDPNITALAEICADGVPMPAFPQMAQEVWNLLGGAQARVIAGADPTGTARRLYSAIKATFDK